MRTVVRLQDAYLLEPIQEPIPGWRARPGTFRVAQPYDRTTSTPAMQGNLLNTAVSATEAPVTPAGPSAPTLSRACKKRKLSRHVDYATNPAEQELVSWIRSQFQALLEHTLAQSLVDDMSADYFYGTCVDAPASEDFSPDLVKLQSMLRMLRTGLIPAARGSASGGDMEQTIFDEIMLEETRAGTNNQQRQVMDLSDIYETLVMNEHPEPSIISFLTEGQPQYLIPPRSGFIVSDLDRIDGLKSITHRRGGFDIIVMDPPWQNASVDRMSHYGTLDLYELFKIPIPDLLRTNTIPGQDSTCVNHNDSDAIVAVWITNRAKVKKVVIEKLFPAWGLELVAHWYWLKITTHGEPVLSLENTHRRAYEGILIGRRRIAQPKEQGSTTTGPTINKRLLVSVPSQHSRKPSLMHLLEQEFFSASTISCDPSAFSGTKEANASSQGSMINVRTLNRLELFARNLEEGVLSWGNEPVRYQYCGRGSESTNIVQDGYWVPSSQTPP
ncbi:Methyltransferase-like protein 4 [Haplosporangium sp. Z 11]|nr:Methyltransferase-like protein 4 [Haplosporangium sp. Z 11]